MVAAAERAAGPFGRGTGDVRGLASGVRKRHNCPREQDEGAGRGDSDGVRIGFSFRWSRAGQSDGSG